MSDIDFDELDRAVASVLAPDPEPVVTTPVQPIANPVTAVAPTPVTAPLATDSEVTPVTVTVNTPPAPVVTAPEPTPTPAPVSVPVAVPAQSLHTQAIKPVARGQFLDMIQSTRPVAPRPVTSIPATPPAPTPNGPFVSDVVAPTSTAITPAVVAPTLVPATPAPTEPAKAPEVIDFFAASPDDTGPHKAPEVPVSPFIPDAKVDKRPLGAFSLGDADTTPSQNSLHDQLVAVESEDNIVEPESPVISHTFKQTATVKTTPVAAKPTVPAAAPAHGHHFNPFERHEKPVKAPKIRPDKVPKYGKGTLIWVTVAVAVMLIGFGVGATLYFLVLQ